MKRRNSIAFESPRVLRGIPLETGECILQGSPMSAKTDVETTGQEVVENDFNDTNWSWDWNKE